MDLEKDIFKNVIFQLLDGINLSRLKSTCKFFRKLLKDNTRIKNHYVYLERDCLTSMFYRGEKLMNLYSVPSGDQLDVIEQLQNDILYPQEGRTLCWDVDYNRYILVNNFYALYHFRHEHWDETTKYLRENGFTWFLYEFEPIGGGIYDRVKFKFENNNSFFALHRGSCVYISWCPKNKKIKR